ncbi:hypothetical protein CON39_11820 [Bacillus thuringiensis]|uniref:hypothetical protein n=1 Tax=Bacillus thuringiensis TaxID=1428 RepID=UPI000BEE1F0C|nr:hypothetical protein [Bacillus thuringiensis]PEF30353.1 hypothetical protein CON39_11820 [Bacillus thuringiensis]
MNTSIKEQEKRQREWVKTLEVGDEVAIQGSGFARYWYIYKVVKITPSGRLNLSNGLIANPNGTLRGDTFNKIYEVTDDIRKSIWRRSAQYKVSQIDVKNLPDEALKKMLEVYVQYHKQ